MKQFTYTLVDMAEVHSCLRDFLQVCPEKYSALLVTVFPSGNDREKIRQLAADLSEGLPDATIVGSTNSGGIAGGDLTLEKTVLTFMVFREAKLQVIAYEGETIAAGGAGAKFMEACTGMEDLVGIELIAVPRHFDAQSFFDELKDLPKEVAFFGGNADTFDLTVPSYLFIGDRILESGILAVCFCGASLHIHVESVFGWKPLGAAMRITATEGKTVIRELDGKPAFSVYEKYLQIVPSEHFHEDTLEFPLLLEREGDSLARLPDSCREDGALVLNADCRQGESVRLAYGDYSEIIYNTQKLQQSISRYAPEGIMIFTCISRMTFLQERAQLELAHYEDIAPHAGIYTHGEYDRRDGKIRMLNMTLVSACFREGDLPKDLQPIKLPEIDAMTANISLVQRLARFINVTSTELEAANHQLTSLAQQDRLTRLYNRGEIESIFKAHLGEQHPHLSAIMLDLDNFKSINDTFGHETGDKVLISAARVLSGSIRSGDSAGRWGGEEFFIVLPKVPHFRALEIAERIRRRLEEQPPLEDGRRVTASFGVAEVEPGEDYAEFYKRLDEKLYIAKKNGKNCVV